MDDLERVQPKLKKGPFSRGAMPTAIRFNKMELDLINKAAELCVCTRSTFIRYCAVKAAEAVTNGTGNQSRYSGSANSGYKLRGIEE